MRSLLFITAIILTGTQPLLAQPQAKIIYPVAVSFNSMCCGVPSDSVIRSFIISFKKKYKIKKITAYHIGPMGREGEYDLAFKLTELGKKNAGYFISKMKKLKPLKSDKGSFTVIEKFEVDSQAIPKRASTTEIVF